MSSSYSHCKVCGKPVKTFDVHLSFAHKMTLAEYIAQYGEVEAASIETEESTEEAVSEEVLITAGTRLPFGSCEVAIREIEQEWHRDFIQPHDPQFHKDDEIMEALAHALDNDKSVLLVGPTGCGKSTHVLEMSAILDWPLFRVNLTGEFRVADFVGEKVLEVDPSTGQSVVTWRDGVAPQAMNNGFILLLDEADAAPPEVQFAMQAVLETGRRRMVLTGDHGRVVNPSDGFRIVATANSIGRGDDSGLYAGVQVQNEAWLNRWDIVLRCTYPSREDETLIVAAKTDLNGDNVSKMIEVATRIREAFDNEQCFCTFSMRQLIAWGQLAKPFDIKRAAQMAVLNRLSPDDRHYVAGVMQRVFGRGSVDEWMGKGHSRMVGASTPVAPGN